MVEFGGGRGRREGGRRGEKNEEKHKIFCRTRMWWKVRRFVGFPPPLRCTVTVGGGGGQAVLSRWSGGEGHERTVEQVPPPPFPSPLELARDNMRGARLTV